MNVLLFLFLVIVFLALAIAVPEIIKGGTKFGRIYDAAKRGFKTETLVRHLFNKHVRKGEFREVRGDLPWLVVSDSSAPGPIGLDLDGYNPDLKIAFEYQGPHHYKPPSRSGRVYRQWLTSRYNDLRKTELCAANGVRLIKIDGNAIPFLEDYVLSRLDDLGALKTPHPVYTYHPEKTDTLSPDYGVQDIKKIRRFGADSPVIT